MVVASNSVDEYTPLKMRPDDGFSSWIYLEFLPVEGFGHFGHLRHYYNYFDISPSGWTDFPGDNTPLQEWYKDKGFYKSMFAYDEANQHVVHISEGKVWCPLGGHANPSEYTPVVLHEPEGIDAEKFVPYFGVPDSDKDEYPMGVPLPTFYPDPNLHGDWKMVRAFLTPSASYYYKINYKEGMSQTSSVTSQTSWMFSAGFAKGLFGASAEYSGFVQQTSSSTWESETSTSFEVTVPPGDDFVIWRFVFEMDQYGEKFDFQSTVIADTNSMDVKPDLKSYIAGKNKYKIGGCLENTN